MGHAPENTLASIRKALELGVPCIEVDVYHVEGHLVVFHDDRLERTTNGSGYLCEQSFEYIRSLDAGDGEKIPTLEEVCEVVNLQSGLNIELKGSGAAGPVVELISNLRTHGWSEDLVLVSSFNRRELEEVRRLDERIKLGVLIGGPPADDVTFAENLKAYSIHPSLEFIDRGFVEDAHSRSLRVFVYTVNHLSDIQRMEQLGVDGVFTDFPERVLGSSKSAKITIGWS